MKDIAERLVDALYAGSPVPAGCRVNHARGLLVEGRFLAGEAASRLSTATLFDGDEHPLVARFSSFSGDPLIAQDDTRATPCGLALDVDGQGGLVLVGHSANGFPAGDPERFLAFVEAQNIRAREAEQLRRDAVERSPAVDGAEPFRTVSPRSFAALRYHMLHTYVLTDAEGMGHAGRLVVFPSEEEIGTSFTGADRLDDELRHRLESGVAEMSLGFVLARPGDATDDISAAWPGDRAPVLLGRLLLDRVAADQDRQRAIVFDPSRLPPGVDFSGDPMVDVRARAYRLAAERRTASSAFERADLFGEEGAVMNASCLSERQTQ